MFEAIRHLYTDEDITSAEYAAGEVWGSVSFFADGERSRVMSSIGPDSAVRECVISHYPLTKRRHKARTSEEVQDYS